MTQTTPVAKLRLENTIFRADFLLLALAVGLPAAWLARGLGFYSDDWAFLWRLELSEDRSFLGMVDATTGPAFRMRILHPVFFVTAYRLFGLEPYPYHLVNVAYLVLAVLGFYCVLRFASLSRVTALTAALIWGWLPNYSGARYWPAAFATTQGMAFGFLGAVLLLAALRARPAVAGLCLVSGSLSLLASGLSYEVQILPFLLIPFIAWRSVSSPLGDLAIGPMRRRAVLVGLTVAAVVAALLVYKVRTTVRMERSTDWWTYFKWIVKKALSPHYDSLDYGLNIKEAIVSNFGVHVFAQPHTVLQALELGVPPADRAAALALTVFVGIFIARRAPPIVSSVSNRRPWRLVLAGMLVFALGYAVFLTNYNVQFPRFGIGNRTAIAAALGVALVVTAIFDIVARIAPRKRGHIVSSLLVACFLGGSFLVHASLATFWRRAYEAEVEVLTVIKERFPTLEPGTTFLLDGVCPYEGPAIVFESCWDLQGALIIEYRDSTLAADILSGQNSVEPAGIQTRLYKNAFVSTYPYGSVLIHDIRRNLTVTVTDAEVARQYFEERENDGGFECPPGAEGHGAFVFR